MAKRLDCPYIPGRRSQGWVKVKNKRTADVVVGGWLPGEGGRSGRLGALVVGFYEDGELRYAGRAGSGFTESELKRVQTMLEARARDDSPFTGTQPPKLTRFVEPQLVASVEYSDMTQARHAAPPGLQGPARRRRPGRRRRARRMSLAVDDGGQRLLGLADRGHRAPAGRSGCSVIFSRSLVLHRLLRVAHGVRAGVDLLDERVELVLGVLGRRRAPPSSSAASSRPSAILPIWAGSEAPALSVRSFSSGA